MEYNVELLEAKVKKINVNVQTKTTEAFELICDHRASAFEPNDESDPTIMIRDTCTMSDAGAQQLSVEMVTEFIFKFDPIPDDRTAAASKYCQETIKDKSVEIASAILHDMGHNFVIGK